MPQLINHVPVNQRVQRPMLDFTQEDINTRGCCMAFRNKDNVHIRDLPRNSVMMTCPNCRMGIKTKRVFIISRYTHIASIFLCCIPYCLYCCKDVKHYCPLCGVYIGISPVGANSLKTMKKTMRTVHETTMGAG